MKQRFTKLLNRLGGKTAATLTEYTFIIAIVSIAGVVLLAAIGTTTKESLESSSEKLFGDE